MIDTTELKHLLFTAANSAVRAGALIMEVYNSDDFQVNLKSDATPLTLADRKSNSEIVESLMKTRIPVLSEEGRSLQYEERKGWEYFWLVDPLDGTKEFIKRNGEFTVNIALIYNGFPILGVIYVPVSSQLYLGLNQIGSYLLSPIDKEFSSVANLFEQLGSKSQLPIVNKRDKYTIVISRSHTSDETKEYIENLKDKYGEVEAISKGSSLKICLVAEGKADIYPRLGKTTEWDTAAGQAIAENAGCNVVSLEDGKRMRYNKEDLENPWFFVCTNTEVMK